ncbi:DUF4381 domain-containing protein [Vibrio campbellii]
MSDNRILLKGFIDPASNIDVSWLPTTIGWKVSLVLILMWGAWKSFHFFQSYRANKYRRLAVKAISRTKQDTLDNQRLQQELRIINSLLKQVACCSFPRSKVAMLSGDEWAEFLMISSPQSVFDRTLLMQWQQDIYKPALDYGWTKTELSQIRTSAIAWVKGHTRGTDDRV